MSFLVLAWGLLAIPALRAAGWQLSLDELAAVQRGEVLVLADMGEGASRGEIRAAIRVGAPPEKVFDIMTDCTQALLFVPHLEHCAVIEAAPDRSWEVIEQEIDYGWYLPRTRYVFRAQYERYARVRFSNVRGDFRENDGLWELQAGEGGSTTVLTYRVRVVPRFYVPGWLLRRTLRRDLPAMLNALRARCEAAPDAPP